MDAAELELALTAPTFFLRLISLPKAGAGKVLDVAEVEQEFLWPSSSTRL